MTHWTKRILCPATVALATFLLALVAQPATAQDDGLNWTWQTGETFYYQWSMHDEVRVAAVAGIRGGATREASHNISLVLRYEVLSVRRDVARLQMTVVTGFLDASPATEEGYRYDSRTLSDLGKYFDARMRPFPQLIGTSVILEVDARGNIQSVEGDVDPFATAIALLEDRRRPLTRPERLGVGGLRQFKNAHQWVMPGFPQEEQEPGDTFEHRRSLYSESGQYEGNLQHTYEGTQRFRGMQVARLGLSMPEEPRFHLEDPGVDETDIRRIEVGGTLLHGTQVGRLVSSRLEMRAVTRATLIPARADERHARVLGVRLNRTINVELLQGRTRREATRFDDSELDPQQVWQGIAAFRSGVMLQRDASHGLYTRLAEACTRFLEIFAPDYAHQVGDRLPRQPRTDGLDADELEVRLERYARHQEFYEALSSAVAYLTRLTEVREEAEFLVWLAEHAETTSQLEGLPTRLRAALQAGKARAEIRLAQQRWQRAKLESYRTAINTVEAALKLEDMSDETFERLHEMNIYAHLQIGEHDALHAYLRQQAEQLRGQRRMRLLELHVAALVDGRQWERVRPVSDDLHVLAERNNNFAGQVAALEGLAKAQLALTDRRRFETLEELHELGREGRRAVRRVERFARFLPMQRATNFDIPRVDGEGRTQLRHYGGRHLAMVFFRSGQQRSIDTLNRLQTVLSRYEQDVLAATAIGASQSTGESEESLVQVRERVSDDYPMDWLWDRTGSVARAYGVERHPVVLLINPAGRIVWADRVLNVRGQMNAFRDVLERELELGRDAPFVMEDDEDERDLPEFRLLNELMEFVNMPREHLAWLGQSVERRAELLGENGRMLMRSLLILMLLEGEVDVDRDTVEALLKALAPRNEQ